MKKRFTEQQIVVIQHHRLLRRPTALSAKIKRSIPDTWVTDYTGTAPKEIRTFARHAYLKNQRAPIVKASTSPANSRLTPAENCSVK